MGRDHVDPTVPGGLPPGPSLRPQPRLRRRADGGRAVRWHHNGPPDMDLGRATWMQHHSADSPPFVDDTGLVYDRVRRQALLFGGCCPIADTWTWGGASWTRVFPRHSPPP